MLRNVILAAVALFALVGASCATEEPGAASGRDVPDTARAASPVATGTIQPVLVNSALSVGPNRVAVAFVDGAGGIVDDVEVRAAFTADGAPSPMPSVVLEQLRIGEHGSHGGSSASPLLTVYGATVDFPSAGKWNVVLRLTRGGATLQPMSAEFSVVGDLPYPMVGEAIPPTRQAVLRDVAELKIIDTSQTADDPMHRLTVAEALALNRPLVIGFATPAFCETRMCGPVVEEVLRPLQQQYGDAVEVIHIEPFDVVRARAGELVPVPAMAEWGLSTEPWVFVVDAQGRVAAKFEGPLTFTEVDAVVRTLGRARN